MKSIDLKESDSIPIKKYVGMFGTLFVIALVLFFSHFFETPFTAEEVTIEEQFLEKKSEIGFMAPDFVARTLEGNRVGLENYKGQVIILNLWATWCGPCRVEMPGFENLYRRFRSEGLTILAVSLDKGDNAKVKDFVEKYQLSFPVLIDQDEEVAHRYPTFTIPTTYVIDKQGRVVAKVDGAKNWESEQTFEALELLLGKA